MASPPFAIAELRYRTLTHTNPGRCLVELHAPAGAQGVVAVASALPATGGPSLVNGACAIAARVRGDLLTAEQRRQELTLVVHAGVGPRLVSFAESFDGWFGAPSFAPLTATELEALVAGTPASA
jgi:hypothetical protein